MSTQTLPDLSRRGFLYGSAACLLLGVVGRPMSVLAAGLALDDGFPIPADKRFTSDWTRSLTARGGPTVYSSLRDELKFIGMPIGGLCCGQVYLGGDGQLWHWDILNLPQEPIWTSCSGDPYVNPPMQKSPFDQGFDLAWVELDEATGEDDFNPDYISLNAKGIKKIEFRGEYPIGRVSYRDRIDVELEAFSPFCPLDVEGSSLPAVVLNYTIKNPGKKPLQVLLTGRLQNPVCLGTAKPGDVELVASHINAGPCMGILHSARAIVEKDPAKARRSDVVFEDWERGTYDGWTVTGKAFGDKPREVSGIAGYQGNLNAQGKWTVNTHETRHGEDVGKADTYIGTLTSREFTIDRDWIRFRIGGGKHPGQTCVNLLIDGAPVRTSTGRDSNRMHLDHWDVREFAGRKASIQIVDGWSGGWGQIGIDEIVFTDSDRLEKYDMLRARDYGTMVLAALGKASCSCDFNSISEGGMKSYVDKRPTATVQSPATIKPGESHTFSFVIAWHFPNPPREQLGFLKDIEKLNHHYAARFKDAGEVATYVLTNLDALTKKTRLWRDTWYDSTLPHWFLDRTFATVATAATATCYRFDNGRFYGWEGAYSCAGTCTHVWQYAQALARVFPALERSVRERIDFDQEFDAKTGIINYRGEAAQELAIDGQCGTIIRAYREHTMTSDDTFLRKVYPNVKKAMQLVISRDVEPDGILDGPQYNTLDTTWYGEISWITSLYLAALRTTAAMATDAGDNEFASQCRTIADKGRTAMVERLFNGEYFIHKPDPAHPEANSTGTGCHIDQVFGQSMAFQAGLTAPADRVIPKEQTVSALKSLYKYSLATDVRAYRVYSEKTVKGGRWYAVAGEGGLLMCTWPKGGSEAATGKSGDAWAAGYFNECMNGFEHQVASHMLAEGLITEGLAVTRLLHDRHHAAKRNPWNEIECGNHYSRSMAAYGSFVTACGFASHGPHGELQFDPKVMDADAPEPKKFKAAFITATAWGSYEQDEYSYWLSVVHGTLTLGKLKVPARKHVEPKRESGAATLAIIEKRIWNKDEKGVLTELENSTKWGLDESGTWTFDPPLILKAGQLLRVGHVHPFNPHDTK